MLAGYRIRTARTSDVPLLGAIEARAGELFSGLVPEEVTQDNVLPGVLDAAATDGRLFVADTASGEVVGFAIVILLEDANAHLEELDVVPEHGRRGLGTALVEAACRWAKASGHATLTLATYRNVPFNAPFYAKIGFRTLGAAEVTPALARVIESEHAKGLDIVARVVMRRDL